MAGCIAGSILQIYSSQQYCVVYMYICIAGSILHIYREAYNSEVHLQCCSIAKALLTVIKSMRI